MLRFIVLLFIPYIIFASKILNYNIYDRTDRVDVMITFDTPFKGIIKQSRKHSKIVIKLYNAEIDSSKIKKLSTKFVHSISITPMFEYTQIVANVPSSVKLLASKTTDAYGLRLRFIDSKMVVKKEVHLKEESKLPLRLDKLPTKEETVISKSYYLTIGLLFLGIIILFLVKKRVIKSIDKKNKNPWLFQENIADTTAKEEKTFVNESSQKNEQTVTIRFQKKLDNSNNVVMLDFGKESYLILLGNGNILLDKFVEEQPNTEKAFEEILQARSMELNQLIKNQQQDELKEPLQAYKEKASSIA